MASLLPGNYCLEGYIDVPEPQVAAISEALKEHIRLTREEPGCIYFHVDPSPDVPGRFVVAEAFQSKAAFDFHQDRAQSSEWGAVSREVKRNFKTWVVE